MTITSATSQLLYLLTPSIPIILLSHPNGTKGQLTFGMGWDGMGWDILLVLVLDFSHTTSHCN